MTFTKPQKQQLCEWQYKFDRSRTLGSRVQDYFNLLAIIVAGHENQKRNNERSNELSVNLTKMDTNIKENLSDNFSLKCWLCKNNQVYELFLF